MMTYTAIIAKIVNRIIINFNAIEQDSKESDVGRQILIIKNRDDKIRTCDPRDPNTVRYQAALHPDILFKFQLVAHLRCHISLVFYYQQIKLASRFLL